MDLSHLKSDAKVFFHANIKTKPIGSEDERSKGGMING
jgi:hypothetical protein